MSHTLGHTLDAAACILIQVSAILHPVCDGVPGVEGLKVLCTVNSD